MALPEDARYKVLKTIWWYSWGRTTYPDMKWAIQDVLQREESRKKEREVAAQHTEGNEDHRRRKHKFSGKEHD